MAHHDYPVGWTSPVSLGHVPGVVEYELLWDQVVASINGDDGGTWAPSAWVTVGGSGFQFTGTGHTLADGGRIRLAGTGSGDAGKIDLKVVSGVALIDAENGSAIRIKSGASLDVFGTLAAKSGSVTTWESGATATLASGATFNVAGAVNYNSGAAVAVKSGSTWAFESGATVTLATGMTVTAQITVATGGSITLSGSGSILGGSGSTVTLQGTNNLSSLTLVGASTWPELATTRTIVRKANKCIPLTYSNGGGLGPLDADVWESKSPASDAPCWRYRKFDASGKFSLLEVIGLPIGAVITSATITAVGSEPASVASTLPYYQIVSWVTGLAAYTNHSLSTVDAASSSAAFATTAAETTVAATGTTASRTVDETRRYGILVTHPYEATNDQGMIVYNAYITATVGAIKL